MKVSELCIDCGGSKVSSSSPTEGWVWGFGLIWDIGSSDMVYGENWQPFYELIRPFIKHVHLKDQNGEELTLPGEGSIPIVPIVKRLIADGYDGCFSLEWEKKWCPEIGNIEPALDKLTELLSELK